MQKKKPLIKKVIFTATLGICACVAFYGVLSLSPSMLMAAQSLDMNKMLKQGLAQNDAAQNDAKTNSKLNFNDIDIMKMAFPDNKKGCVTKASMFLAASKNYKDGKKIEDIVPMKAFYPVLEHYYEDLRKQGVGKAAKANFDEFTSCVKTAKPYDDIKKEQAFNAKFSSCQKFSDALFDIVSMIENRNSAQTIMAKYKGQKMDLSGTPYADMKDPGVFFAGQLYSQSKKGSLEDVQELGSMLALTCYM